MEKSVIQWLLRYCASDELHTSGSASVLRAQPIRVQVTSSTPCRYAPENWARPTSGHSEHIYEQSREQFIMSKVNNKYL